MKVRIAAAGALAAVLALVLVLAVPVLAPSRSTPARAAPPASEETALPLTALGGVGLTLALAGHLVVVQHRSRPGSRRRRR